MVGLAFTPAWVTDAKATAFCRCYFEVAQRLAPQLETREPINGVPAGSTWIYFKPSKLPRGVDLVHKIPAGHVDLQFAGMAAHLVEMNSRFAPRLEPDMRIARAGKSVAVRIAVPPGDITQPFEIVAEAMETAVRSAARLLAWYAAQA